MQRENAVRQMKLREMQLMLLQMPNVKNARLRKPKKRLL
jgi:hypothetical protein